MHHARGGACAWSMIVLALGLAACRREAPPPIASCPTLTLGAWQWIGVIGPPHTVGPNEQVILREEGGERLWYGLAHATSEGSFAIRGARRAGSQRTIVLETSSGRRFAVRAGRSEGMIDYEPGTLAVTEEGAGTMTFHGWLAPTPVSTPIERAWAVSWATGAVAPIEPTPLLGIEMESATVRGGSGECMTVFSEHASGGTGGCWWPRPGSCICHLCTAEQLEAGTCVELPAIGEDPTAPWWPCGCQHRPPATADGANERAPLPARERLDPPSEGGSGPAPPFYQGATPEPLPPPPSPDAGHFDAGPEEPPS